MSVSPHHTLQKSPEWSPRTKRTVAIGAILIGFVAVWALRDILPLMIVSALIAYILNPLVTFLSVRILRIPGVSLSTRRGLATVTSFLLVLVLFIVGLLVIVPVLIDQLQEFGRSIPQLLTTVETDLERVLSLPVTFNGEPVLLDGEPIIPLDRIAEAMGTSDLSEVIQLSSIDLNTATETFLGSVGSLTGSAFSFLGGAFNTIINITFLLMLTFYLLKDSDVFVDYIVHVAPPHYESDAKRLVQDFGGVWDAYVRGQLILCLVMGFSVYFAALLLGVPNAPILGLLAGILEFIPNLGPFIALIPAAFLALVSQSSTIPFLEGLPFMLVVIGVWIGLQNIEAIFLVPRVMGNSLDLHPYVVIIGVLGGAALAGALGVILAAPFIASGRLFVRYIYGKITGRSPFIPRSDAPPLRSATWLSRMLFALMRVIYRRLPLDWRNRLRA